MKFGGLARPNHWIYSSGCPAQALLGRGFGCRNEPEPRVPVTIRNTRANVESQRVAGVDSN
jgi:hypothetical protein